MERPSHMTGLQADEKSKAMTLERKRLEEQLKTVTAQRDSLLKENARLKVENDNFKLSLVYPILRKKGQA